MIHESPGQTIRLYVAEAGHDLDNNYPDESGKPTTSQTLSFHPHHCNLTLIPIMGQVMNWTARKFCNRCDAGREDFFNARKYLYQSKINAGFIKFVEVDDVRLITMSTDVITPCTAVHMPADLIHTVACPKDRTSAWFVLEGKEDVSYQPVCYSTSRPDQHNYDNLYKKCTEKDVRRILKLADLLPSDGRN